GGQSSDQVTEVDRNGTGQPISVERTTRRNDNPLDVSVLVSHEQSILPGQYPSCQPVPDQPLPSLTVCWDNAVAETLFASLKNEMYHQHVFTTRPRARMAVAEYIEVFYNRQRPHSSLNYRTPARAWDDYENLAATASTQAA